MWVCLSISIHIYVAEMKCISLLNMWYICSCCSVVAEQHKKYRQGLHLIELSLLHLLHKLENETGFEYRGNAVYSMNCLTKHSGLVHFHISLCSICVCVCISIGTYTQLCNSLA